MDRPGSHFVLIISLVLVLILSISLVVLFELRNSFISTHNYPYAIRFPEPPPGSIPLSEPYRLRGIPKNLATDGPNIVRGCIIGTGSAMLVTFGLYFFYWALPRRVSQPIPLVYIKTFQTHTVK